MPGGAPAVEEGAGSFAVGCGGLPLCGASAFPGTRRLRTDPRGLPGGQVQGGGAGRQPTVCPPIRCVPACSPFPPRPAVCPLPHPLCAPIPPGHPAPPRSRPALCPPPRSRPALFPCVPPPTPCFPVPTLSVPQRPGPEPFSVPAPPERVPRECPEMEGCAESARAVVRRAGSAGGGRANPRGGSPG